MYEEYLEKQKQLTNDMQNGKGGSFRLLIHEPATEPGALYNCIIYKTDKAKVNVAYYGMGMDNTWCDNIAVDICLLFVRALRNLQGFSYIKFDEEPNEVQLSIINNKVYFSAVDDLRKVLDISMLKKDPDLVKSYSDVVEISAIDCAKQVIADIEQSSHLIFAEDDQDDRKFFARYFETLKLLVNGYKSALTQEDQTRLEQNLSIIDEHDKALKKMRSFWEICGCNFISKLDDQQKEVYYKLQQEKDEAFKKF